MPATIENAQRLVDQIIDVAAKAKAVREALVSYDDAISAVAYGDPNISSVAAAACRSAAEVAKQQDSVFFWCSDKDVQLLNAIFQETYGEHFYVSHQPDGNSIVKEREA